MGDLIWRLLARLTGWEWRLYFVKQGVGLQYALHNKGGFQILGHLHAKFESGQHISDQWTLYMGYYTGAQDEEYFQLTETMFTAPAQFKALESKCRTLDKNWDSDCMKWNPYFMHVPTRRQLPLGLSFELAEADDSKRRKLIERTLDGGDEGLTFSNFEDEVFQGK